MSEPLRVAEMLEQVAAVKHAAQAEASDNDVRLARRKEEKLLLEAANWLRRLDRDVRYWTGMYDRLRARAKEGAG